jgi:hypothetical protein
MKNVVGVKVDRNVLGETSLDRMKFFVIQGIISILITQKNVRHNRIIPLY